MPLVCMVFNNDSFTARRVRRRIIIVHIGIIRNHPILPNTWCKQLVVAAMQACGGNQGNASLIKWRTVLGKLSNFIIRIFDGQLIRKCNFILKYILVLAY